MSRRIFIPLILIVVALSIVAIVKAQEWSAWSNIGTSTQAGPPAGEQASGGTASPPGSLSNRLKSLQTESPPHAETPGRFQPESPLALPPRRQDEHERQPPSLPASGSRFEPPPRSTPSVVHNQFVVEQAQATDDVAPVKGSSIQAWPTAQADAALAVSNQPTTIDQGVSSRRSPTQMAPAPRLAQRPERPTAAMPHAAGEKAVLFEGSAPVLSVKASGPPTIVVGKSAEYVVQIGNAGAADAEDVAVWVDVPGWLELSGAEATAGTARMEPIVDNHGRVKWTLSRLDADTSETLTLTLAPRQSRPFDLSVRFTHKPHGQLAQIEVQEPKLEMLLSGPPEVLYGETKTYSITVSNPGTGAAENVEVNLLPVSAGQQDSTAVSKLGNIPAGGRKTLEFELTARQAGELELRAAAFAEGGLRSEAAQRIHVRRAALETVMAGPQIKYAGTVAVYQFRVANTGDAPAENVVAEAVLPRGAAFMAATEGGAWQAEQGRVHWPVGTLRPGASRVFEVRCTLAEAGSNRLQATATAEGDLSSAAHWVTQVEALADLKLLVNDPQGPLPLGEPVVYEVRVINRGTKAAEGVQIAAFFSDGVEALSVEGAAAEIGIGQVVFQPLGRIVAGQEVVFKITAKAVEAGNHTFRTEVVCSSPETKLATQVTTRFYSSEIRSAP